MTITITKRKLAIAIVAVAMLIPATAVATHVFSDVDDTKFYADATKWAKDNKITLGSPAGSDTFKPDDPVTRGESVTFLKRYDDNIVRPADEALEDDIATNTKDISTNRANVATNAVRISTNARNISTNARNTATNTASIAALVKIQGTHIQGTYTVSDVAGPIPELTGDLPGRGTDFVYCASRDIAMSGGVDILTTPGSRMVVEESMKISIGSREGWQISVRNESEGTEGYFNLFVNCLDVTP